MATPTTEPWQRACSGELVDVDLEGEGEKVGELGFVQGVEGDHYHRGAAMNGRCVADLAMDKRATATAPCMNREKEKAGEVGLGRHCALMAQSNSVRFPFFFSIFSVS